MTHEKDYRKCKSSPKKCELQRVFNFETGEPEGAIPLRGNLGIIVAGATSDPGIGFSFAKEYAQAGVYANKTNYIVLTGKRGPGSCNDLLTARVNAINAIAPGSCIGITLDLSIPSDAASLITQSVNFFSSKGVILNLLFLMPAIFDTGVFGTGTYDLQVARSTSESVYWAAANTLHAARNVLFTNSQNADVTVFFANSVTATSLFFVVPIYQSHKAAMDNLMKLFKVQNPKVNICQMYNGFTYTEGGICLILSPKLQDPINPGPCETGGNDPGLMRLCPPFIQGTAEGDMTADEVAALYAQAIERFEEKTYQNLLDRVSSEAELVSDRVNNYGLFIFNYIAVLSKQIISEVTIKVQKKLNKSLKYRQCLKKKIKHPKTIIQEMASKVYSADKCNALGIVGFEHEVDKILPNATAEALEVTAEINALFANNVWGPLLYFAPSIEDQNGLAPVCNCDSCPFCLIEDKSVARVKNVLKGRLNIDTKHVNKN